MKKIIAFSLLVTFMFACKNGTIGNKKYNTLFETYYEVFPEASITKGTVINQEVEREAFMFYTSNHLDRSAAEFGKLYDQYRHPRHKFYAAVSNLGFGNIDLAITQFESLSEEGNLSTKYMLDYYLGLTYLKKGEVEKAKSALNAVGPNFQYYKKKAESLVAEL